MESYLVLKTTAENIKDKGSVFEAIRGHWVLDQAHAKNCQRVVAVVDKVIQAVFTNDAWYPSTTQEGKWVFAGELDQALTDKYIGKTIKHSLTVKGALNPVQYSDTLLEDEDLASV